MSLDSTTHAEDPRVRLQRLRKINSATFAPKWSRDRVTANILYRCPLSEALGFIALEKAAADPQKLAQLSQRFAVFIEERNTYNDREIRGNRFPAELEAELAVLRSQMLGAVEELYGDTMHHALADHLSYTYHLHSLNLASGIVVFH